MDARHSAGRRCGRRDCVLPGVRHRPDVHTPAPPRGRALSHPESELREHFDGKHLAVVGGAGFVGSNLTRRLVELGAARVDVIDNLLSAERSNVPDNPGVTFVEGSITDDEVLRSLPSDLDSLFHLATYHGNQNSMADPIADHDNNTFTTLKLLDHLRTLPAAPRVVYSSAGCTVAQKTFDEAAATTEDDPVSLHLDSPY